MTSPSKSLKSITVRFKNDTNRNNRHKYQWVTVTVGDILVNQRENFLNIIVDIIEYKDEPGARAEAAQYPKVKVYQINRAGWTPSQIRVYRLFSLLTWTDGGRHRL